MIDLLTIIAGAVIVAMLPAAIRDLKRGIRAARLITHITGAVSAPEEK